MDTRVRYLLILAAYIAVVIVAGTAVTVRFTDLDPVDSFYYVVQTLWTVGTAMWCRRAMWESP